MAIRFFKAATPGTRHGSAIDFSEIQSNRPEKSLTSWYFRSKGRNNRGIITSRHRGGGHKRLYREIDFGRTKVNISAKVTQIEYDPNRNSRIALVSYLDGEKRYILHPVGLKIGDTIKGIELDKTVKSIISMGTGPVMKIEIDDAHTYVSNGLISHNKGTILFSPA